MLTATANQYPYACFVDGVRKSSGSVDALSRGGAVSGLLGTLRRLNPGREFRIGASGFTIMLLDGEQIEMSWTVMDHDYRDFELN